MRLINSMFDGLTRPETVVRYRSLKAKKIFRWFQDHLFCRRSVSHRRKLLDSIDIQETFRIQTSKGYALVNGGEHFGDICHRAVEEATGIFKRVTPEEKIKSKRYLLSLVTAENALPANSDILSLATSPEMIKAVGSYLGCLPVLTYANVWYSPVLGEVAEAEGSQRWHLDHEDLRQMKVFIYCSDVDDSAGPMWLVDADTSLGIAHGIGYSTTLKSKRVNDQSFEDAQQVSLTGCVGDIAFVDTSSCFHLGSRNTKKPRLLIALQYLGPQAYVARTHSNPELSQAIKENNPHLGKWLASFSGEMKASM